MAGVKRKTKNKKNKKQREEKYNAENEIIIGVTTKPKEVRVDKKRSTRTKPANNKRNANNRKRTSNTKKSKNRKEELNTQYVKNKHITKDEEIKKINRKKVFISLFILLIIVIAGIIYFLTTPMFNITNIEVTGNEKNSVDTYVSLTKIELNSTNIFEVTKNKITKNIKENPYVESVQIKRKLPSTLEITVTERKVSYQAEYNDNYIYLDKQGYVLELNEKKKDTIIIEGLETTKGAITEGQRLNNEDLFKLDTVLKLVNCCKYNSIQNEITSINVSDTNNYTIKFDNGEKTAYLGNNTKLNEKVLSLKQVLEKEEGNKGEIFVDENALERNRVYFKQN